MAGDLARAGTVAIVDDLGLVERIAGIAATAAGEWAAAERHFENALRQAEAYPYRVEQPEVRRWYARVLLDRGGPGARERARTLLSEPGPPTSRSA